MSQDALHLVVPTPEFPVCAWCGEPAAEELEIAPARFSAKRGFKEMVAPARTVPVCKSHAKSLELTDEARARRDRQPPGP